MWNVDIIAPFITCLHLSRIILKKEVFIIYKMQEFILDGAFQILQSFYNEHLSVC